MPRQSSKTQRTTAKPKQPIKSYRTFSHDIHSGVKINKNQDINSPFVKIKRDDFHVQGGFGLEFFAPYFKFGIELKYSQGFINSFIQDNTSVSKPIDLMYNRVWMVSFIFEG